MSENNKKTGGQQLAKGAQKAIETAKAIAEAASGNWARLIKLLIPVIALIFYILH